MIKDTSLELTRELIHFNVPAFRYVSRSISNADYRRWFPG